MTDVALVLRAMAGDQEAVSILHARYGRYALALARRHGAGDDAEDIVQDVFLTLVEARGWHVRPEQAPDGLLRRYIAGMVRHLVKQQRRRHVGAWPALDDLVVPMWAQANESPEDRALRAERLARLRWAIASLSQRQRQIAVLRFIECLPGSEIAEKLGLSQPAVYTHLYQIREALRPRLAGVYRLPKARYGFVKFDGLDRPRNARDERYRAKRRRARAAA